MVNEIRIYVEGGGHRKDTKSRLREAFGSFFRDLRESARSCRMGWRIVVGGSRTEVLEDFTNALQTHTETFNVLLIDAEGAWQGSTRRQLSTSSGWHPPEGVRFCEDQVHFMIQIMESWFLADRGGLRRFYGRGFRENRLPANPDVEAIPKADVLRGLVEASRDTQKGSYDKTRHAPEILSMLNPQHVRQHAPACDRLFQIIEAVIDMKALANDC